MAQTIPSHDDSTPPYPVRPSLDSIPAHIVQAIAEIAGEQTIRALMRTCRALRAGSEPALIEYLAEATIVGEPPFIVDIFTPIDPKFASRDNARGLRTAKIHSRFDKYLEAYPPAAEHLRCLTVEVEDSKRVPGWALIRRFAPVLEHLTVHMQDCLWELAIEYEDGGDDARSAIVDTAMGTAEVWDTVFINPDTTSFPFLTRLNLCTSARGAEHLARLAKYAPNLREITLSCHFKGVYDMDQPDLIAEAAFEKLERLTITGHSNLIFSVLAAILPVSPILDYLTVHISESIDYSIFSDFRSTLPMVESIVAHKRCKGVALFGCCAREFPIWLRKEQDKGEGQADCEELRTLVLEQTQVGGNGQPLYPILSDPEDLRPHLNVERIIWVDKRGQRRIEAGEKKGSSGFYDKSHLDDLFAFYPTIQQVQWVSQYPDDPFAPMPHEIVKCSVDRDASETPDASVEE